MIDAIEIASSALRANQTWLDTISHNVANMQTVGFKKANVQFVNLIRESAAGNSQEGEPAVRAGAGIRIGGTYTQFSDGAVRTTNQPLDVAIVGNGFLEIVLPGGETGLTRVGALRVDADGRLMCRSGWSLQQDIRISPDVEAIEISAEGKIRGKVANSTEVLELGEIELARVAQPEYLQDVGEGVFKLTEQSGDITLHKPGEHGTATLLQGHLEMSNVDLVEEMSNLVIAQRAYQLNARVLQTSDQLLETINNLRR